MRALVWQGKEDVQVETVPDPQIQDPRDVIVRITATAICGSDLHLYDGIMPTMEKGDVLGHEPMGEVVEVGSEVKKLKRATASSCRSRSPAARAGSASRGYSPSATPPTPTPRWPRKVMGQAPAGLFGYSHMLGGFPGGQAEYLRVPYADVGPIKIPDGLPDEQVLFLSDIFPTGYMAAENAEIEPGDTVAVWGCGPVGQFAIQSAWMLGAGRVIAIDRVPERLAMAATHGKAETIDFEQGGRLRAPDGDDQGPRPGPVHRRGRQRGAPRRRSSPRLTRRKQAMQAGDRPAARAARGDHVLPQGRHGLDPRRLHRHVHDKFPFGAADEQGPDHQDGPDPRAALHQKLLWR